MNWISSKDLLVEFWRHIELALRASESTWNKLIPISSKWVQWLSFLSLTQQLSSSTDETKQRIQFICIRILSSSRYFSRKYKYIKYKCAELKHKEAETFGTWAHILESNQNISIKLEVVDFDENRMNRWNGRIVDVCTWKSHFMQCHFT